MGLVERPQQAPTGFSPSPTPFSKGIEHRPSQRTLLKTTTRRLKAGDSQAGLFPVRSPLLGESWLVSFPPLIDMLKFSGCPCLISGRYSKVFLSPLLALSRGPAAGEPISFQKRVWLTGWLLPIEGRLRAGACLSADRHVQPDGQVRLSLWLAKGEESIGYERR